MRILQIPVFKFTELPKAIQKEVVDYHFQEKTYDFKQDDLKKDYENTLNRYESKINYTVNLNTLDALAIEKLFLGVAVQIAEHYALAKDVKIECAEDLSNLEATVAQYGNPFMNLILSNLKSYFEGRESQALSASTVNQTIHQELLKYYKVEKKRINTKAYYQEQLLLDDNTEYLADGNEFVRGLLRYAKEPATA